ncbi:hypothetical protein B9N08_25275 [Escherichia coli]|nr:hypothetical protein B9N08_25275 [Escherichia coli]
MGSCAAPSAKGDDKFITTDYLQQCRLMLCFVLALVGRLRPSSVRVRVLQSSNAWQANVKLLSRFKCNSG